MLVQSQHLDISLSNIKSFDIFLTVTIDQVALIKIQILRNSLPLSTGKASFSLAYINYSGKEGHYYQRHKRSSTALFVQSQQLLLLKISNHFLSLSKSIKLHWSRSSDTVHLFSKASLSLAFRNHSQRENHNCKATQLLAYEDHPNMI